MIRKELELLKDEQYKEFSESLLPGVSIIGVRLPILRKLSKKITLGELSDDTFEELMLQGMIIGHISNFEDFREECLKFLPKINNWSVCDSFVSSLSITKTKKNEVFKFLESLISDSKEFTRRFVLVMFLRYFICEEYIDKVLINLRNIKLEGYYTEMAYAWCLTEIYLKYKSKFFAFFKKECINLTPLTIKKTISKIKESNKTKKSDIMELTKFMEEVL